MGKYCSSCGYRFSDDTVMVCPNCATPREECSSFIESGNDAESAGNGVQYGNYQPIGEQANPLANPPQNRNKNVLITVIVLTLVLLLFIGGFVAAIFISRSGITENTFTTPDYNTNSTSLTDFDPGYLSCTYNQKLKIDKVGEITFGKISVCKDSEIPKIEPFEDMTDDESVYCAKITLKNNGHNDDYVFSFSQDMTYFLTEDSSDIYFGYDKSGESLFDTLEGNRSNEYEIYFRAPKGLRQSEISVNTTVFELDPENNSTDWYISCN